MRENQNDGGDFGPIEVEAAAVTAIEKGMNREPPFLRVPDSAGDHEAHGEENQSLQERLLANEETGNRTKDAVGPEENLSLCKIQGL